MMNVIIEDTDIRVSRVAFGTASMHHLFSAIQRQGLLGAAVSAGITHFDTSPYYGYGLAEQDLGIFVQGKRSELTLATKVGLYAWGRPARHALTVWTRKGLGQIVPSISQPVVSWQIARARASFHQSLKRLKTDYVDFLYLHEPTIGLLQADEFTRWIETEHGKGTLRSWGLAGVADNVAPWVRRKHILAKVIQTQDSLGAQQADFMNACGRSLQFTYGYMASGLRKRDPTSPEAILRAALRRNTKGSVIVSSRNPDRISRIAKMAS